ncbi:MAG: O-antigen ligase family protein [Patescibacteria group bacterium]
MKEEKESWLLSQDNFAKFFFYLLILFLPTQFGRHFWPQFSFIQGLRLDYLSPTIYLTDIFIILIIIFSFEKIINFFKKQNKKNIFLFLLFFLSLFIGVFNSKNPQAGVYGMIKIIEYLFLGIYIGISFANINKKHFVFILIFGIIFESALSFLQLFNNGSLNGVFYFLGERYFTSQTPGIANASINGQLFLRPYATFPHPNVLAGYLVVAMVFISKFKKHTSSKLFFFTILIGTASLFLTLSRVAILIWSVYLIFLFYIPLAEKYKKRNSNKNNTTAILTIFVLVILISAFFLKPPLMQRFIQTKFSEESFVQREYLIKQSIGMFIKNPMFGVGINNFYNNLEKTKEKTLFIQPVHNIFLLVLSETGLVGVIYFLIIFYKSLKREVFKDWENRDILLIPALIVLGMFDHYFLTVQQGQIMILLIFSQVFSARIRK